MGKCQPQLHRQTFEDKEWQLIITMSGTEVLTQVQQKGVELKEELFYKKKKTKKKRVFKVNTAMVTVVRGRGPRCPKS